MNRRQFILNSGVLASGMLFLLSGKALAEGGRRGKGNAGGDPELVSPKDNVAKAVGYIEDFKKSGKQAANKCSNCTLYVKGKDQNGKEVGACALFPKKLVLGDAYCNSWAKKA